MTYSPWRALGRLKHVTVVFMHLPKGRAWWLPCEQTVVLAPDLTRVERRWLAAHEYEHAVENDQPIDHQWFDRKQERRATKRAAYKLMPLDAIVDALLWSHSEHEAADYLDVPVEALRWRLHNLRASDHQYIAERVWRAEHEMT